MTKNKKSRPVSATDDMFSTGLEDGRVAFQTRHIRLERKESGLTVLDDRYEICLVDRQTELILFMTPFAEWFGTRNIHDSYCFLHPHKTDLDLITGFLNWVFFTGPQAGSYRNLCDLDTSALEEYLRINAYKTDDRGRFLSKESMLRKRNVLSTFLWILAKSPEVTMNSLQPEELITFHTSLGQKGSGMYDSHTFVVKAPYAMEHKDISQGSLLYRDLPESMYKRFLVAAEVHDPELTFPIALAMGAGLRGGEVCNMRQKNSPYGPSILFSVVQGRCTSMTIDLKHIVCLRSDGRYVGGIKCRRSQAVDPFFLDDLYRYYRKHMELIREKPCESYRPLFLNSQMRREQGVYLAMTRKNFSDRVKVLLYKHILPYMATDPAPDVQLFYQQMLTYHFGIHSFRHWFTVKLVILDRSELEIQNARGDSSVLSARAYLANKGRLRELFMEAGDLNARQITGEKEGA